MDDVVRTEEYTLVRLKILPSNDYGFTPWGINLYPQGDSITKTVLVDLDGSEINLLPDHNSFLEVDGVYDVSGNQLLYYTQSIYFEPIEPTTELRSFKFPNFVIRLPAPSNAVELDFGPELPQPGQARELDFHIKSGHIDFHFVRVEFSGDGETSLVATLYTAPLYLPANVMAVEPIFQPFQPVENSPALLLFQNQNRPSSVLSGEVVKVSVELFLPISARLPAQDQPQGVILKFPLKLRDITYTFVGEYEIKLDLP